VDIALLLLVWLSFATWLSLHVILAVAVRRQNGRLKALAGFLGAPLMPLFGFAIGAKKRSLAWLISCALYGILLFFASR
jgi:hypothetical protein